MGGGLSLWHWLMALVGSGLITMVFLYWKGLTFVGGRWGLLALNVMAFLIAAYISRSLFLNDAQAAKGFGAKALIVWILLGSVVSYGSHVIARDRRNRVDP